MNTNVIIGIVAALALAGGGAYVYTQSDTTASVETTSEHAAMGTLKDLMAQGSSKCTVTNTVANSESTGTVYIGDGKMRGDFTTVTTNPAMTVESHMISDGEMIYTWSNQMPQGIKMSVSATAAPNADAAANAQVDMYNAQVNYDCDSWNVDASQFEVPATVEFMDMNQMMQGAMKALPNAATQGAVDASMKAGASATAQQCAACDQLPDSAKAQCKAALQCK
jgi:hypothetical protein